MLNIYILHKKDDDFMAKDIFPTIKVLYAGVTPLKRWDTASLSAPYWRFYWNDRPGATLTLNDETVELLPSRFVVIPPQTPVATRLITPLNHFSLQFLMPAPWAQLPPQLVVVDLDDATERTAKDVLLRFPQYRETESHSLPVQALALLYHALATISFDAQVDASISDRIHKVISHIHYELHLTHVTGDLGNDALATIAGMHYNAFTKLFRKEVGIAPQKYVMRYKVEQATYRLQRNLATIDTIADDLGFCDRYHFSRIFRQYMGIPPGRYQRERDESSAE